MSDRNANIIEEFRGNEGRIGGHFDGWTLLLLHHTGAKTGTERINPLAYQAVDGGYAVFASKGGATDHPDWYHNLVANPSTSIEVGSETLAVIARVAEGGEHDRIWDKQKQDRPNFAEYENTANRKIPVIVLGPVST